MSLWSAGVGARSSLAVEIAYNVNRVIYDPDGFPLPSVVIEIVPPLSQGGTAQSVTLVDEIPSDARIAASTGYFYTSLLNPSGSKIYFIYDPSTDTIYKPRVGNGSSVSAEEYILSSFLNSPLYANLRTPIRGILDPVDLVQAFSGELGPWVKKGFLILLALFALRFGMAKMENWVNDKTWFKSYEREVAFLQKNYDRESKLYADDAAQMKRINRKYTRLSNKVYEKYGDQFIKTGEERLDIIRTE